MTPTWWSRKKAVLRGWRLSVSLLCLGLTGLILLRHFGAEQPTPLLRETGQNDQSTDVIEVPRGRPAQTRTADAQNAAPDGRSETRSEDDTISDQLVRAVAFEMEIVERQWTVEDSIGVVVELPQLVEPNSTHSREWLQRHGYPAEWNRTAFLKLASEFPSRREGVGEAYTVLGIDRGEFPQPPPPLRMPNGTVISEPGWVLPAARDRSFSVMLNALYQLGLIGPGFLAGAPQPMRNHTVGLASNLMVQRMGDRSILPAVLVAHPDFRFPLRDYLLAQEQADQAVGSYRALVRRRGAAALKDGWREFD